MYLHIGQGAVLYDKEIIGIFDLDKTTVSKKTRSFLNEKEKSGKTRYIGTDLPQSFIITQQEDSEQIFITQTAGITLKKRMKQIHEQEEYHGTATRV